MRNFILFSLIAATLWGCATAPDEKTSPERASLETVWSGVVEVRETIKFPRGSTLKIEPGTVVKFAYLDEDDDGLGDISIIMEEGFLEASATLDEPIIFTSEEAPASPGSWGEIRLDFSTIELDYVVVEGSSRGLHLHFSSGEINDSVFRDNLDGTRVGESKVTFNRCLFTDNTGKGFNARASKNTLTSSWFRNNRRGVFLFEGDKGSTITGNRFTGNGTHFRLGDFYKGEVATSGNEWESEPRDYAAEGTTARLMTSPKEVELAGPSGWPLIKREWMIDLDGFVDAISGDERGLYFGDWGGTLHRIGLFDGSTIDTTPLGDMIDAEVALGRAGKRHLMAAQLWDRTIRLYDPNTLEELDRFTEEESAADDHRQSSPIFVGETLIVATWGGKVRAFDVREGELEEKWIFDAGAPIRGKLGYSDHWTVKVLYVPAEDGTFFAIDPDSGVEYWRYEADDPFLSGPAIEGSSIFVADKGGHLHALDTHGGFRWKSDLPGRAWYAKTYAGGGMVIQGDDSGSLSAFDGANGSLIWRTHLDGGIRSGGDLSGSVYLISTLSGYLYAISPVDGFIYDRVKVGEAVLSTPKKIGGQVFVGARPGNAGAFRIVNEVRGETLDFEMNFFKKK